jgi:hypothetical protein
MDAFFEASRFQAEAQSVIAMRLFKMASGDPGAFSEAQRMVSEKIAALGEAQQAMLTALTAGQSFETAAAKAYTPYRRTVHANHRRLSR